MWRNLDVYFGMLDIKRNLLMLCLIAEHLIVILSWTSNKFFLFYRKNG
jgi:hypothetical protein